MKELLDYLVKSIVKNKDDVEIDFKDEGKTKVCRVLVNKSDIGAVIGKGGNTAQAIRTIVKSYDSRKRVIIKFDAKE